MYRFENNQVAIKSYALALETIKLVKYIQETKIEYVLTKQIMRSGTAPGALIREALQGESKADFIHKLSISLKEAHETEYWLLLMIDSEFIVAEQFPNLFSSLKEVIALLTSILKTTKGN